MRPNETWSLERGAWSVDFVHDQIINEQKCRVLTVVDVFIREALAIELSVVRTFGTARSVN